MERTCEPEVMEGEAQAEAYAKADFNKPNQAFLEHYLRRFGESTHPKRVVDLGCGPGDITARMAHQFPNWQIEALDASAAMLQYAKVATQEFGTRLRLLQARLPEGLSGHYDVILSNSLLHHLPEPSVLWQTIRKFASPGAHILVADLYRPMSAEAAQALVSLYAAQEAEILQQDFLASLHAAFRPAEILAQLQEAQLLLNVEVISDRHVLVYGRL
jgi:2-polyprenyl-3-methyl-5-hydroxy-6-metoxy-1,4-benzoquinol methylase